MNENKKENEIVALEKALEIALMEDNEPRINVLTKLLHEIKNK